MEIRSVLAVVVLFGTHSLACAQSSASNVVRYPDVPASEAIGVLVQGHDPRWWFVDDTYPMIRYAVCNKSGAQSSFYWHGANFGMFDRSALPDERCALYEAEIETLAPEGVEPIEESELSTRMIEFGNGYAEDFPTRIWCDGLMGDICGSWISRVVTRLVVPRRRGNETDAQTIASLVVEKGGENSTVSVSFDGIGGVWVGLEREGLTPDDVEVRDQDFQEQELTPIREVLLEPFLGQVESNNILALEVGAPEGATTAEASFVVTNKLGQPISTRILAISDGAALFTFAGMSVQ